MINVKPTYGGDIQVIAARNSSAGKLTGVASKALNTRLEINQQPDILGQNAYTQLAVINCGISTRTTRSMINVREMCEPVVAQNVLWLFGF